jgi:hypothetical protein
MDLRLANFTAKSHTASRPGEVASEWAEPVCLGGVVDGCQLIAG